MSFSRDDHDQLPSPKPSMIEYLLDASIDVELDLERDQEDHGRPVTL